MKKVMRVLVVILLILLLAVAGAAGFSWYRNHNIFVDDAVYPIDSKSLDLREEDISFDHYESVRSQLPDCEILWKVPFQGDRLDCESTSVTVKMLTEEDVAILAKYFPDLKTVDALACSDYRVLQLLKQQLPQVEVAYQVSIGATAYAPDTTELVLNNGDYDFVTLKENLTYLTEVETVTLRMPELTQEQIEELRAAYGDVAILCTVALLGEEYDVQTTRLNLSAISSADVAEVVEKLPLLPNMTDVELMAEDGTSQLTKEDVKLLMEAAPNVVYHYTFDFFGETLSTADEDIHIKNKRIGDAGLEEVRAALDILTNCKRFVLEYCSISNEAMAQLREDYRDRTKIVWRIYYGDGGSCLTDVQVVKAVYGLVDDNCEDLIYCEDVLFMDIGHNEWLDAVPFVAGMTKLRGIIVSGSPIKDLTPFANCKDLEFLEMAFCEYVEDLSPLASCESLAMLNISNTHALDLSPLDNLPLTHLVARTNPSGRTRIPAEEQERFAQQHPDCWASYEGAQPYGVGWRYDTDELTPLPYYALLRQVFKYDASTIPNNTGWYLDDAALEMLAQMDAAKAASAPAETVAEETVPEETMEETAPVETTAQE